MKLSTLRDRLEATCPPCHHGLPNHLTRGATPGHQQQAGERRPARPAVPACCGMAAASTTCPARPVSAHPLPRARLMARGRVLEPWALTSLADIGPADLAGLVGRTGLPSESHRAGGLRLPRRDRTASSPGIRMSSGRALSVAGENVDRSEDGGPVVLDAGDGPSVGRGAFD